MTRRRSFLVICAALVIVGSLASAAQRSNDDAGLRTWPREFVDRSGNAVILYPPQINGWRDFQEMTAVAAIVLRRPGSSDDTYGAVRLAARTAVDHAQRTVTIGDIRVTETMFPYLDDAASAAAERALRRAFPTATTLALDRVLAEMDRDGVSLKSIDVAHTPPKIIISEGDALLVQIDGAPVYIPIEDTGIEIVANSSSDLFRFAEANMFYVKRGDFWLESPSLEGPWTTNRKLPEPFFRLPDTPRLHAIRVGVRGRKLSALIDPPLVYVTQEPTELLIVYGEPEFEKIPNTDLEFVVNTESDLFRHGGPDGLYYALFAGRWFRTPGDGAPLEFCTADLPAGFARIPASHPCGRVLVSVPGTRQAEESIIASQIARTAIVSRRDAKVEITFDGEPVFAPTGAAAVEYAANTSSDVFRTGGRYYACDRGVWFTADAATGPWEVCDDVPTAMYELPPTCPGYPAVFVYVYDSNEEDVTVGYLPGYEDTYYSAEVVVHGLGFEYDLPEGYYVDRYRGWTDRFFQYHRLHETYGYGYHWDHPTGRYRRGVEVRRHHAARAAFATPYESWNGEGVAPSEYNAWRDGTSAPEYKVRPAPGGNVSIFAADDGEVYRRNRGAWERYDKQGWRAADPEGQEQLDASARARSAAEGRGEQNKVYRGSYGSRTPDQRAPRRR